MANEFKLKLIENAEDFLLEAVRYAKASTPRDWKYAVLHLCSALELLLKALLDKEYWGLLFEDVNKASQEKLKEADFQSVNFTTALDRLQSVVGLQMQPKDSDYLKKLRKLRNCSTHFEVNFNVDQAKSLVARSISIFLNLQQQHLHQAPDKTLEYEINQTLQEFQRYVNERLSSLRSKLEASERPHRWFRTCPICTQETLVSRDDEIVCLFCGEKCSFDDLAVQRSEGRGGPCPDCEEGALEFVLLNNDDGRFVCVRCGFEAEHDLNTECAKCGAEFWMDGEEIICQGCISQLMEGN